MQSSFYINMIPNTSQEMEESYGTSSLRRRYLKNSTGKFTFAEEKRSGFHSVGHFFRTVFLPQGYPDSVSDDYLTYQIWDTIQAFASSITGTLAHQAVLKGYGVGDESATILAATLTWLLKDGAGMMGRILFAWMQGTNLDCDAKRWRLFADIINDIAICLDILGPHFPAMFTFIVCVSGVLKSIVGVSGGATRAALTQHQARRNNMADVSAKDGSQETLVNLAALLCSFILVPIVTGHHVLIWTLYILFTCLHLYSNFSAVRCVVMETLNQARLHILLQEYFKTGTILSPRIVNSREPVLWSTRRTLDIKLGVSISSLAKRSPDMQHLLEIFKKRGYLLWTENKGSVNISLSSSSGDLDQLKACYHAELLNFLREGKSLTVPPDIKVTEDSTLEADLAGENNTWSFADETFPRFLEDLSSHDWNTGVLLLGADEWRTHLGPGVASRHVKQL
ncbi:RUS family member 1-like [Mya arenaria]|uniref:RUS family member 1-like n=1 Tax=Mya arenaria TaxID=6604 RepID=UPI0022E8A1E9|nr:RUS family member 1-like [Mya arenaria]